MRPAPLLAVLVAALALSAAGPAGAAPTDPAKVRAAAEEFDAGRRAYKAHDLEQAALHFENADRDAPNPEALRNAIRCRREAKQRARATTLAAAAVARYPDDAALSAYAAQIISEHERDLASVAVTCKPACSLVVDGKVAPGFGDDVLRAMLYLESGSHELVAGWPNDHSARQTVDAAAGVTSTVLLEEPPEPPPAPVEPPAVVVAPPPAPAPAPTPPPVTPPPPVAPAPERHGLPPTVFGFGVGATLVIGGVAVWSALDTRNNPGADRVRQQCVGQGEACALYQDGLSRQSRTNVLLGVTGGLALTSAALGLFFTDWSAAPSTSSAQQPRVVPVVAWSDGATIAAVGRF